MIDYVTGRLVDLTPTYAVVEAAGVGYMLSVSLTTYAAIEGLGEVKLYAEEVIREDAHLLYGFHGVGERAVFRQLVSVSGVGAGTARVMLSALSPVELQRVVARGEVQQLKAIKGIGAKTAERIVVELRDKIQKLDLGAPIGEVSPGASPGPSGGASQKVRDEALEALEVMGYNKAAATKVVDKLLAEEPGLPVEQLVKKAFRMF